MDSRGLQDIYVQAFSENSRPWHLDTIVGDLEEMIRELQTRPLHEPITLDDRLGAARRRGVGRMTA